MDHNGGGCSELAQNEYKRRHDNLGKVVHQKLARKCNFEAGDKWYEHEPESVLKNEDYKILWDFLEIVGLRRRRKIRQKNIKTWEGSCRRYGMLK